MNPKILQILRQYYETLRPDVHQQKHRRWYAPYRLRNLHKVIRPHATGNVILWRCVAWLGYMTSLSMSSQQVLL